MKFSRPLLRFVSAIALLSITTSCLAQAAPTPGTEVNPAIMRRLQNSRQESSKITLIETGGVRVRGIVTDIQPEYVSITVKYGTPSVHVPYGQIDHIDHPPLTHQGKVILGVIIGASVVGIAILVAAMIKHA